MRKLYIISAYDTASYDLNIDNMVVDKDKVVGTIDETIENFEKKYNISRIQIHFRLLPIVTNTNSDSPRFITNSNENNWFVERELISSKMRTNILSKIDRLEKERTLTNNKLNDLYNQVEKLRNKL